MLDLINLISYTYTICIFLHKLPHRFCAIFDTGRFSIQLISVVYRKVYPPSELCISIKTRDNWFWYQNPAIYNWNWIIFKIRLKNWRRYPLYGYKRFDGQLEMIPSFALDSPDISLKTPCEWSGRIEGQTYQMRRGQQRKSP